MEFMAMTTCLLSGECSHEALIPLLRMRMRAACLCERWRFDQDDEPTVGPEGADEQDCILIDNYGLMEAWSG